MPRLKRASSEGPQKTHYHFEYGESSAYTNGTAEASLAPGFEDQPASAAIAGLQPGTTYHFRVVAENELSQKAEGPDQTFTTLPPVSIESESVTNVSDERKALGRAEPARPTDRIPLRIRHEHLRKERAGPRRRSRRRLRRARSSAWRSKAFNRRAHYHYRVVAHNSLGTSEGARADRTFATQGAEAPVPARRAASGKWSPRRRSTGYRLKRSANRAAVIEAASDGSGLTYIALGAGRRTPGGQPQLDSTQQLLASDVRNRGHGATQDIATPHQGPAGVEAGNFSEYRLFSSDLSRAAVEPLGATRLARRGPGEHRTDGIPPRSRWQVHTARERGNVPAGTKFGGEELKPEEFQNGLNFVTGTPSLSHALLTSPTSLVQAFATGGNRERL